MGGTNLTAGDVLGATWDRYAEDVMRKISAHVRFCDLIGARRAVWYAALSGILYASAWFPNPWWTRAVTLLRSAVIDGRLDEAFYRQDRTVDVPPPEEDFWDTLSKRPAELTGPQCEWVQGTRLQGFIHSVRDTDRQRLGPLDDTARFPGLAVMF